MHRIEHLAEEFGGDADIGGHLFLGQAFDQRRVHFAKAGVPVDGGEAEDIDQPRLVGGKRILAQNAEEPFKFGNPVVQRIKIGPPHPQDGGVFQCIDIQRAGLLPEIAVHIADPPAGRRKLQHMLEAVAVHGIAAQQAFGDKIGSPGDLAFLLEELFLFKPAFVEKADEIPLLLLGEADVTGDMLE